MIEKTTKAKCNGHAVKIKHTKRTPPPPTAQKKRRKIDIK